MNGHVLPVLALAPSSHGMLPDLDFEKNWLPHINRPFFSSKIVKAFDEALLSCSQISGILTCRDLEKFA